MKQLSRGPLSDVRVVDMTTSYAGPTASMYLADLGATVMKVERPRRGDDTRHWGPPFVEGVSAWFASANRNKDSIALDLRHPDGVAVLHRLLEEADVFLHNVNPSKVERLGIDDATLRGRNQRLIYCAMSGFGLGGPDSGLPGYDLVAQARSGLMSVTGALGGPPQRVSTALSDIVTAMSAAIAVSAALVRQSATGLGESIDVSLLDSDLALMAPRLAAFHAGEPEPRPSGGTDSVLAVYQPFQTKDRTIVVAIGNDAMWERFCQAVGLEEFVGDKSLADNAGRRADRRRVTAVIADRLRTETADHWLRAFSQVGVPASRVQSLSEVVTDPQVVARNSLLHVPGSAGGLVSVRAPFRLQSQPKPRNERFPALGEDSRRILADHGYSADQIENLITSGAVGADDRIPVGGEA